jgi:hypothetical protein
VDSSSSFAVAISSAWFYIYWSCTRSVSPMWEMMGRKCTQLLYERLQHIFEKTWRLYRLWRTRLGGLG